MNRTCRFAQIQPFRRKGFQNLRLREKHELHQVWLGFGKIFGWRLAERLCQDMLSIRPENGLNMSFIQASINILWTFVCVGLNFQS